MTHDELIDGVIKHMGAPAISAEEREAIHTVLDAGARHGFGNMISWLATGWSDRLRENGLSEASAVSHANARGGYPLPPKPHANTSASFCLGGES